MCDGDYTTSVKWWNCSLRSRSPAAGRRCHVASKVFESCRVSLTQQRCSTYTRFINFNILSIGPHSHIQKTQNTAASTPAPTTWHYRLSKLMLIICTHIEIQICIIIKKQEKQKKASEATECNCSFKKIINEMNKAKTIKNNSICFGRRKHIKKDGVDKSQS